jgi:putative hydrolase of the HAD superfamily
MMSAVVFDLFETLITESSLRPAGVASLASEFSCDRESFRREWKARRADVTVGRISFRQALHDVAAALDGVVDDRLLDRVCRDRVRTKHGPFAAVDPEILSLLDALRDARVALGVISNCFAEDVTGWPSSALASRVQCALFSHEVGLAKPDPRIYLEAASRLGIEIGSMCYVGDGGDDELSGAAQAGARPMKATWFLRRWPHYRGTAGPVEIVGSPADLAGKLLAPIR